MSLRARTYPTGVIIPVSMKLNILPLNDQSPDKNGSMR